MKPNSGNSAGSEKTLTYNGRQKKTKGTTFQSESTLQAILENTNDFIWSVDKGYRIIFCNTHFKKFVFKLTGRKIDLGDDIKNFVPDHYKEDLIMLCDRALNGQRFSVERERNYNGNLTIIEYFFNPIRNERNEVTGLSAFMRDITERKKSEEAALNEKETVFNRVLESVVSVDNEWRYTFLNDAALTTHPLGKKETLGKVIWDVHPELVGTVFGDIYHKAMQTRKVMEIESYYAPMNIWFFVKVYPSSDGLTIFYRDITARKLDEKKFIENELKYRSLVEQAPDGILITNQDEKFIDVNTSACKLLGYTREEFLTMTGKDIVFSDEKAKLLTDRFEILKEGKSVISENKIKKKDGTLIDVETDAWMLPDGQFVRIVRDLTERKQREKYDREIQQRLKAIFNGTTDAILLADDSGKYVQVNPAASKLLGYTEDEFLSKTVAHMLPDNPDSELWDEFTKGGNQTGTIELMRKDREIIICKYNATRNILPGLHLSIVTDITESKRAEDLLRKSESRLAEAQKLAQFGNWDFDLVTGKLTWSEELYRIFGTDKKTFTETYSSFLHLVDEEDREIVHQTCQRAEKEGNRFNLEYRVTTAAGKKRVIHEQGYAGRNSEGKIIRLYGTVQDITERKKADDALFKKTNELKVHIRGQHCLYTILQIINTIDFSMEGVLQECVNKIPAAYQYPEITCARITLGEKNIHTDGFKETGWKQEVEMEVKGKIIGRIEVCYKEQRPMELEGPFLAEERWLINSIAKVISAWSERKSVEAEIKRSRRELRELSAHLQTVREEERMSIAREIHDELGQQLTGLKMGVSWISKKITMEDKSIQEKLSLMVSLIDDTVKTVRRISSELRPGILDTLGLISVLEWQCNEFQKRTGIKSQFHTHLSDFNPARNLSTHVFRVYQEALTNVARHAHATQIESSLDVKDGYLRLIIKDNGLGFDIKETKSKNSWGLIGMKERAIMFRGSLTIESEMLKGTVVTLKIPLVEANKLQA